MAIEVATGCSASTSAPAWSSDSATAWMASLRACSSARCTRARVSASLIWLSRWVTIDCRSSQVVATMSCAFLNSKSALPLSSSFFSRSTSCVSSHSEAFCVVTVFTERFSAM